MNKQKLIEALNMAIEAINEEEVVTNVTTPAKKIEKQDTPVVSEESVETETEANDIDVEALKKMKYNEFKKYASQLGVKCTGTRDEIMERILALDGTEDTTEEVVEETEEEAPAKSDNNKPSKKLGKTKTSEPARDEFDEQAEEIAKDTDVADIIGALEDVNIKANKKNAVEKLAYALREGLIELDDEEDDTDDSEDVETEEIVDSEEETTDEEDDITPESYFSQFDPEEYNDPASMSKARAKAIKNLVAGVIDQIESEQIGADDITEYLEDNCTEEELELLGDDYSDEDLIGFYIEMIKRTVDNDGEQHEPSDPYELGETDMCCGHELKYSKKTKKYICEVCGTEYEAE